MRLYPRTWKRDLYVRKAFVVHIFFYSRMHTHMNRRACGCACAIVPKCEPRNNKVCFFQKLGPSSLLASHSVCWIQQKKSFLKSISEDFRFVDPFVENFKILFKTFESKEKLVPRQNDVLLFVRRMQDRSWVHAIDLLWRQPVWMIGFTCEKEFLHNISLWIIWTLDKSPRNRAGRFPPFYS